MITKRTMIMTALTTFTVASAHALEKQIVSPDGQLTVIVSDNGGQPTYQVSRSGQNVLLPSPLGVKLNFADLTQGVTLKDCAVKSVSDSYELKPLVDPTFDPRPHVLTLIGVKNLILYHTEDRTLETRKERYSAEAKLEFTGQVWVPDDLEKIPLDC